MSRLSNIARRLVDPSIALVLALGYVLLLLNTVDTLGYARDEGFYFRASIEYSRWFERLVDDPADALERSTVDRYFKHNHEHPAFVKSLFALSYRYLYKELGLFSESGTAFRFPGMLLSGLAVAVVYLWGRRAIGRAAGLVAALSLAMMPRVFYHAHLDCFDMPVLAMWLVTTDAYARSLERGGIARALFVGVLYGLLLNTKHNAWLLPFALIAHFLVTRGLGGLRRDLRVGWTRAPLALLSMAVIGPVVFYATWPWLWYVPVDRFADYVAFHTGHEYYNMEFLGRTYFEAPMPRGYAWLMTAATVPAITLLLFAVGVFRSVRQLYVPRLARLWHRLRRRTAVASFGQQSERLFSTVTLWGLCLLACYAPWLSESTPIFGGTKHWITAYPFLCLFAGLGFNACLQALRARTPRWANRFRLTEAGLVGSVLVAPVVMTLHSHPWGLSAYTPLVGGAPGAASLGLNRTFWGYTTGAVLDWLNEHAPEHARVYLHDTAQDSWHRLEVDGRVRSGLSGTLNLSSSDVALYQHEQHMQRVEYQIWVEYGTVSPAHVGAFDGVPVILVYERPGAAP